MKIQVKKGFARVDQMGATIVGNCSFVHNSIFWFLLIYTSETAWNRYFLHQYRRGFDETVKNVEVVQKSAFLNHKGHQVIHKEHKELSYNNLIISEFRVSSVDFVVILLLRMPLPGFLLLYARQYIGSH
jgi:hypothetical protein